METVMHYAKNMVGALESNYDVSIFRRYFRFSKHRRPGRVVKSFISTLIAVELMLGVFAYA